MVHPIQEPVRVRDHDSTWTHREFLKEKLRVRERYWRHTSHYYLDSSKDKNASLHPWCWILPDGVVWRTFLPLLTKIVDYDVCKFVLLESAVELMDYRNASPCLSLGENGVLLPEVAASQERSKIQKLVQKNPKTVKAVCDLSIREEECDEWDLMGYSEMSITDRSRFALVRAGSILQRIWSLDSRSQILILSSESDFSERFQLDHGVHILFVRHFVDWLRQQNKIDDEKTKQLRELYDRCLEDYRQRNAATSNEVPDVNGEYAREDQLQEGLRKGVLVKGRFNVTTENPKEAFVLVSSGESYFVDQKKGHFNRAFHQDIVIVKLLPQSHWGFPVGKRRLVHHRDDEDEDKNSFDSEKSEVNDQIPSACVIAIAQQSRRHFVATMVDFPMHDESACLVVPMDIRIPKIRIKTNGWQRFVNHRLLVEVDGWDRGSNYPHGRCIELLGPIADLETEIKCLLLENEVHLDQFSASAIACLPPEGSSWKIPQFEMQSRMDLRNTHRVFSVDPPGCQDIDDAMHARGELQFLCLL